MVSARAENIPTSPDSLLFNLAADWIMRDLAKSLEDPRFPRKLHEALWWGNMRWIIIIALGATGAAAAAQNYFSKEDRSNVLPLPEPKSSPIPTEKPTNRASLATPYPTTTELPPTPRPTRTLYPTDIFTSTPVDTKTKTPPPPPEKTKSEVLCIVDMMNEHGSIEYARKISKKIMGEVMNMFNGELKFISKQPARDHLEAGISFILNREY